MKAELNPKSWTKNYLEFFYEIFPFSENLCGFFIRLLIFCNFV